MSQANTFLQVRLITTVCPGNTVGTHVTRVACGVSRLTSTRGEAGNVPEFATVAAMVTSFLHPDGEHEACTEPEPTLSNTRSGRPVRASQSMRVSLSDTQVSVPAAPSSRSEWGPPSR